MPAIADFVANPRQFLRHNILRSLWAGSAVTNPVRSVKFDLKPFQGTDLATGNQIPVYDVVPLSMTAAIAAWTTPGALNTTYLPVYFCPYGDDEMHSIVVDQAADFMFTTNMDGCSFGVGSATPTGARRVAHVNLRSQAHAHAAQRGTLHLGALTDAIVDPERYMKSSHVPTANYGEIKATTIGVRNTGNGQWRFYYQQFRMVNYITNQLVLIRLKQV